MTAAPKARTGAGFEKIEIESRASLRRWLEHNHKQRQSVWCVTWKKNQGARHVPYADIVEEALCFGWIDSLPRSLDAERSMLMLSPRKPGSNWSKLNKDRVARLTAVGLMKPAGQKAVEEAKRTGRWNFLDDVDELTIPPDLLRALKTQPEAKTYWDAFPPSARRGILEWIKNAKAPDTRTRRIEETARLAAGNIRANQYRQKLPGDAAIAAARPARKGQKNKA